MKKGYGFVSYKEDYEGYAAVLAALGELANATVGNISYKCELSRASKVLLEQSDFVVPPPNQSTTAQAVGNAAISNVNQFPIITNSTKPAQKQMNLVQDAGNVSNQHHSHTSRADHSGVKPAVLSANRLGCLSASTRDLWSGYNQSFSRTFPLFDDGYPSLHPSAVVPRVVNSNTASCHLPPRPPMKSVNSFYTSSGTTFGNGSSIGTSGYSEYHAKSNDPPLRTNASNSPSNFNYPPSQNLLVAQDHYSVGNNQHQFPHASSYRSGQDPFVVPKQLPVSSASDMNVNGSLFDGPEYWSQRQTPTSLPSDSSFSSYHPSPSHSFKQQALSQQTPSLLSTVIDRPALSGSTTPAEWSPSRISLSSVENHAFLPRQYSPFLDFDPVHSSEEYR